MSWLASVLESIFRYLLGGVVDDDDWEEDWLS